ncbi:dermonecrotic toxin SPH-like [Tachypleus tridentatus]|uniref:dermonecrotic toxin SPH-like n=1 Tax=Tachypleus tridentatus TaxID=6853 RepID=UPI003FD19CB9
MKHSVSVYRLSHMVNENGQSVVQMFLMTRGQQAISEKKIQNWDLKPGPPANKDSKLRGVIRLITGDKVLSQAKPIYNIAHMVNTISDINKYLDKGANGIETDVTFLQNGTARWTRHEFPCDCFRTCDQFQDIVEHLQYIHEITTSESSPYKDKMALLFLDLKVSNLPADKKTIAGNDIARKLIENIWQSDNPSPIYVVLSIGRTSDSDVFKGVQETIANENSIQLADKIGTATNHSVSEADTMTHCELVLFRLGCRARWPSEQY